MLHVVFAQGLGTSLRRSDPRVPQRILPAAPLNGLLELTW